MQGIRSKASKLVVTDVEVNETVASFLPCYLFGAWSSIKRCGPSYCSYNKLFWCFLSFKTAWRISSGCRGITCSWIFLGIILLSVLLTTAEFFVTPKFVPFTPVSLIALLWCWTRSLVFLLMGVLYRSLTLFFLLLILVSLQAGAMVSRTVLIYFSYLQSRPTPSLFFSGCGFPN